MSEEMELPEPKKKRRIGGLIATLVIGGAIGSVLGMAMAPKKGSETRKDLAKKAGSAVKQGKQFFKTHEKELEQLKSAGLGILGDLAREIKKKGQ